MIDDLRMFVLFVFLLLFLHSAERGWDGRGRGIQLYSIIGSSWKRVLRRHIPIRPVPPRRPSIRTT